MKRMAFLVLTLAFAGACVSVPIVTPPANSPPPWTQLAPPQFKHNWHSWEKAPRPTPTPMPSRPWGIKFDAPI